MRCWVRAGQGLPLHRHDTMASVIRYGYWTKGQPGRGQHHQRKTPPSGHGRASSRTRKGFNVGDHRARKLTIP